MGMGLESRYVLMHTDVERFANNKMPEDYCKVKVKRRTLCDDIVGGRRYMVSRDDGILLMLGRIGEVDGTVPHRCHAGYLESIRWRGGQ